MIGRRVRAAALSGLTLTGLAVASAAAASPGLFHPADVLLGCAYAVALW